MHLTRRLLRILLLWLLGTSLAHADGTAMETPHARVQLLTASESIAPGETLWAGLRFDLIPHWHVYWRNPGDSGEPPRIRWQLPAGWQAGDVHWPVPTRIDVGPLTNYGYEHEVVFLVPITAPGDLPSDSDVQITADATWLVCKEECIPEEGRFTATLRSTASAAAQQPAQWVAQAQARWPTPFSGAADYSLLPDGMMRLRLRDAAASIEAVNDLWFASNEWGPVSSSAKQTWTRDDGDLVLTLPPGDGPLQPEQSLAGLLVVEGDTADEVRGFTLNATALAPTPVGTTTDSASVSLWLAIGFAVLGGLILNLMPCVLPVLSIKVLGLIGHANGDARRHGAAFVVGVLVTFAALAGLLLLLRAGGTALGWGFQLQEPAVVLGLMYLMLALALNLSGVFSIGNRVMGAGQQLADRQGIAGSVATGVLAVVVATPCTAPFMGTALGFAMTRPVGEAMAVFLALGAGFALPMLLLSTWPSLLKRVPKPGPWMETLRRLLAFPMFGAALWLLWVLSQQVDASAFAMALSGALLLAFALWWIGLARERHGQRALAMATLVGAIIIGGLAAREAPPDPSNLTADAWSSVRVAELQREGKAVFVNFTAAWCITCKVNEQVALSSPRIESALRKADVVYLKGDWTKRDAAIGAELQRYGRSGVPLYVLHPADGTNPIVLPQLLTENLVLEALEQL
ncbi:protein-disulfide reductase DsbD family protein [Thiosocius teredinicola]|uniref:protein-disulfide reductase DsbD family protein n=1 Tax=Thiosocius teredinicola TaxID=1973002 RepID=UPI0013DDB34C